MDKFVIRVSRKSSESISDEPSTSSKKPRLDEDPQASIRSERTERMRSYKDKLRYNPDWNNKKWPWIEYKEDSEAGGMFCSVCKNMANHQYKHVEHGLSVQSLTGSKLLSF